MIKTLENGYLNLPTDKGTKWLHFDINAAFILKEDTGKDLLTLFTDVANDETKTDNDILTINLFTDVAFAAFKAYDLENSIDVDYNWYEVRNWIGRLGDTEGALFRKAMLHNNSLPEDKDKPDTMGKQKRVAQV